MGYSNHQSSTPRKVAYVVFHGRTRGVFERWCDVQKSVDGWPGALFFGYYTAEEAFASWERYEEHGTIPKRNGKHTKLPQPQVALKVPKHVPATRDDLRIITARAKALVYIRRSGHASSCECGRYPACMHL